jgi:copper(I)-binding protein
VIAAVAAAALVPVLAACEAGAGAQTSQPYNPTDGAGTVLHDIAIRNVFVLGPPQGRTLPAGQSASMFLGLVNSGAPDHLLDIAAPGAASSVKLPQGSVTLPMNQPVLLTGPVPRVIVRKLTRPIAPGESIPMIFYFQNAGTITINVPVIARSQYYTTFSPPPVATPTARPMRPTPGQTASVTPGGARSPAAKSPAAKPTTSP